jgi:SAM-dependent methyltransferase
MSAKLLVQKILQRYKLKYWRGMSPNLYLGTLEKDQIQRETGFFIGLSIDPSHFFEIYCNLTQAVLPFDNSSINKVQAEDVLEHIPFEILPSLLDEIYRVLKVGGVFRISVPDYATPFLRSRCAFDYKGDFLIDVLTGSSLKLDSDSGTPIAVHDTLGNSHLWFPDFTNLMSLIEVSDFRDSADVKLLHGYVSEDLSVVNDIPDLTMPVRRCPPGDQRNSGKSISLIVDVVKTK